MTESVDRASSRIASATDEADEKVEKVETAEKRVVPAPSSPADPQPPVSAAVAGRIAAVESGLRRPFEPADVPQGLPLLERMAHHRVPGVSVAVIEGGQIDWARGYGLQEADRGTPVTSRTLFQAASISKAVAAVVALTLVADGTLALDTPVGEFITSVTVPRSLLIRSRPVTLRRLLSHRAQITLAGFLGYPQGAPLPTTSQILTGQAPANTPAIDRSRLLDAEFQYSGGGYVLMQQLLEDVTGKPFAVLAHERVLGPLKMTDSTFAQPLPAALHGRVGEAHDEKMQRVKTGWMVLPELTAAGLWTTSQDLARFAVALLRAQSGAPGAILPRHLVKDMLRSQRETPAGPKEQTWGLGVELVGTGPVLMAKHDGFNPPGYLCTLLFFPATGQGAAVMVGSNRGYFFIREILRSLAAEYGWPGTRYRPQVVSTRPLSVAALDRLAGRYQGGQNQFEVRRVDQHLRFIGPGPVELDLYPVSDHEFFVADKMGVQRYRFTPDAGPATGIEVYVEGRRVAGLSRKDAIQSP